jgi:hypothetical protein
MPTLLRVAASLFLAMTIAGCAAASSDDDSVDESGQAQTGTTAARSCRPFLMDMSVAGRGVGFERMCGPENESIWAMTYNTVIEETQPVRIRFQSKGEHKEKLDQSIQRMVSDGVTRPTTTFLREKLDPVIALMLHAPNDAEKKAAQDKLHDLFEQHLLSL